MSKRNTSKLVTSAVLLALASATAYAGPPEPATDKKATKEQKIGMATGATVGAIIGGPFGAGVGFIVGALTGTGAHDFNSTKKKAKSLEGQLARVQQELALMTTLKTEEKAAGEAKLEMIYEQLAQRLHADLLFRTASADLDATATGKLADLGKVLAAYPDLKIDIDGYADPRGKSQSNDELSQQRAMAVRAALIVGGASPDNIRVSAHGEKLSTAPKDDLEAYAWERRVSLSVRSGATSATPSQVAQVK